MFRCCIFHVPPEKTRSDENVSLFRTVVVTRGLSLADYEGAYYSFDLAATELPYITAIGTGPTFAYHKSHAVNTLKVFAMADGAPTCICER